MAPYGASEFKGLTECDQVPPALQIVTLVPCSEETFLIDYLSVRIRRLRTQEISATVGGEESRKRAEKNVEPLCPQTVHVWWENWLGFSEI